MRDCDEIDLTPEEKYSREDPLSSILEKEKDVHHIPSVGYGSGVLLE